MSHTGSLVAAGSAQKQACHVAERTAAPRDIVVVAAAILFGTVHIVAAAVEGSILDRRPHLHLEAFLLEAFYLAGRMVTVEVEVGAPAAVRMK